MSEGWSQINKKKKKKTPQKPQKIFVLDPDDAYNMDPIDFEIYNLLKERYPNPISCEQILKILRKYPDEENKSYQIQDIWDAFDIGYLRKYVECDSNKCYILK